jgi:hypothetical protein
MIHARLTRAGWLALALVLAAGPVGLVGGCDPAQGGGSSPTVKDPPPPPGEMTSDDYIKQQAKTRPRTQGRALQRR